MQAEAKPQNEATTPTEVKGATQSPASTHPQSFPPNNLLRGLGVTFWFHSSSTLLSTPQAAKQEGIRA